MTWLDVAKLIAPLAPTLGGILGGFIPFPGAAAAGQALGNVIARSFGVPATPDAVAAAIAGSPNELAIAKLNAATEQARIEVDGFKEAEKQYFETLRTAIGETGQTMREEIRPENRHWFFTGWRPASGWVFVIYAAVFGAILMYAGIAAAFYDNRQALQTLTDAWPIYAAYFGILAAMVGVYVVARTADKINGVDTTAAKPKPVVKK